MTTGRRALITGAASGIGLETARRLSTDGATVVGLDLPSADGSAFSAIGGTILRGDIRDTAETRALVDEAARLMGGIDTVVLSAGIINIAALADVDIETWNNVLAVNLTGAFFCIQSAAPHLIESRRGRVVAISSDVAARGTPLLHAYTASKAGLDGVVQSLAGELAPYVTVNAVRPVSTPGTGMGRLVTQWKANATRRPEHEVLRDIAETYPLGRVGTPDDIAGAVAFLCSDDAAFITGVSIDVDGGAALNTMPGSGS
ncbi:SDR family NAD(P)-dependent oxidoreductase [Prauserella endophytica]|uniref:SDR family oxidoreductase n=1 Tax=Prauserella endophytica TaxID=1592324 RepID=A0ABY2S7K9_9PSEU|nr:SDR family NAD(P)-dependent oxidoreductase [Prauserella endophytica]TKG71688.1 SDR family oxidoreductase [Prauserella endophytica]